MEEVKDLDEKVFEIYCTYQKRNIKGATIESEILKGLLAGQDLAWLFMRACRCAANMMENEDFYKQAEAALKKRYGEDVLEKAKESFTPEATEERLKKLEETLDSIPDVTEQRQVTEAIRTHRSLLGLAIEE